MSLDLHTDDLSNDLGKTLREMLKENFEQIQLEMNQLEGAGDGDDTDPGISNEEINQKLNDIDARISRIIMGTDQLSIRLVLMQILKDEGVIK